MASPWQWEWREAGRDELSSRGCAKPRAVSEHKNPQYLLQELWREAALVGGRRLLQELLGFLDSAFGHQPAS